MPPYRKRRRTMRRRRRYPIRRKKRQYKSNTPQRFMYGSVLKSRQPLPNRLSNLLRYSDYKQVNQVGNIVEHDWRADGLFDIDATGVGVQAPLRDNLFALYEKAIVHHFKAKIRFQNKVNRGLRMYFWMDITTATYDPATSDFKSLPGYLCYLDVGPTGTGASTRSKTISVSLYKTAKRLLEDNDSFKNWLEDAEHQNSSGANPTTTIYLRTSVQALDDDVAGTLTYDYAIDFEQSCIWSRPVVAEVVDYD